MAWKFYVTGEIDTSDLEPSRVLTIYNPDVLGEGMRIIFDELTFGGKSKDEMAYLKLRGRLVCTIGGVFFTADDRNNIRGEIKAISASQQKFLIVEEESES